MAYGLLKRAGAFLLASAMVFGTVSPSLAESLGSDVGGTGDATEAVPADVGSEVGTEAEDETTPPAGSYIICLPEDAGAQYSYDAAHRSEEGSDDAFTILLYEEGERVVIGVAAELGFGLYGADGSLFLKPEAGELDFAMPAQDLQLVFDGPQEETQAQPEIPAVSDEAGSLAPGNAAPGGMEALPEPEAGGSQGAEGTEAAGPEIPWDAAPGTQVEQPAASLKWEVSNVAIEARMADGGSFPEGSALTVDTPDTVMEDEEGAMAYGKAVADALVALNPNAELWALYPFEATLGEGMDLPEGQKEFSVTFSDDEIVQAFQSGIKPAVATYAMDHEAISVSGMEMVPAEDMDTYLTDDGKVAVDFLSETGLFAVAFLKEPVAETDAGTGTEAGTEAEENEVPETEADTPVSFAFGNLRFTEDSYTLLKDADGRISSHTLIGLAADNLGTLPAASAEVSFRFALPEGMSAAGMQLTDGKAITPDGEVCFELWKADENLPAAITAVTAGGSTIDVTVAADSADGMYDPLSGWKMMLYGSAIRYGTQLEGTGTDETDADKDGLSEIGETVDGQIQVFAHAVLKASYAADAAPNEEVSLDTSSAIVIHDAKDAGYGVMPIEKVPIQDISSASIPFVGNGFFMGCDAGSVKKGSKDIIRLNPLTGSLPSSKDSDCWLMFPESFWVYQKDGSVSKYDTKIYFWGDYAYIAAEDNMIVISELPAGGYLHTEWHFYDTGTDTEVPVGGMMYFHDLDPDEGLCVPKGLIGAYRISQGLGWETRNGVDYIVGENECEGQIGFTSSPDSPFQIIYNVKTTGWVLDIKDQAPYQLHYHIQGAPAGQQFPVSNGKSVYVMRGINMKEAEDDLLPQLSAPGYNFDGWYSDQGYQNKYNPTTSMQADVDVYARFTKIPAGNVNVTKTLDTKGWDVSAIPEANRKFTFSLKGTSDAKAEVNQQKEITGAGTASFTNVPAGTYAITEAYNADAWESQMVGSVTAEGGKTAEVACKNILKTGEVHVTKALDTKGMDLASIPEEDKAFTFTLSGTSTAGIAVNKQATINGAGTAKFENIPVGTYTVTEACSGLWIAEGAKEVTVTDGKAADVAFKNTVSTGGVTVTKALDTKGWDAGAIPDAAKKFSFTLSDNSEPGIVPYSGRVNQQKEIVGAGTVSFPDIPAGMYTVTEACNADVWETQMEGIVTVTAGQPASVACTNILKTGEIQVTKALDTKGMDLASIPEEDKAFTFTLSGTSTAGIAVNKQVTITGAGAAKFENIPVGTYTVTEACSGLWIAEGVKEVTVTDGKTADVAFKNTVSTGGITVTKTLDLKGVAAEEIPDECKKFTFTLSGTSNDGIAISQQKELTGAGTVSFEDVPAGAYTVTEACDTDIWELKAPEGKQDVTVEAGKPSDVAFENILKTGEARVVKELDTKGTDAGEIPEENRTFTFALSGMSAAGIAVNRQATIIGAGSAVFEDVPVGTYTVTEACNGDIWDKDVPEGGNSVSVTYGQAAGTTFRNVLKAGDVLVLKTLDLKGRDLEAVPEEKLAFTFVLSGTSAAGTVVNERQAVTGEGTARFEGIPAGTYTLTEECDTDVWDTQMESSVTVTAGQAAEVACRNTLKAGEAIVSKIIDTKGQDMARFSEGDLTFTFTLSGVSAAGIAVNEQAAITGEGEARFEDIPAGTYALAEACDADIWETQMDGSVTVTSGQATEVECTNTLKTGDIQVHMLQKDYKGNVAPLDGIPLHLEDMQGNAVYVGQEEAAWVSKDGETGHLEGIPAGDYRVVAGSVPEGYIPPDALQIHVGYGSGLQEFSLTAGTVIASVRTADKETGKAVDGVRMDVIDQGGNTAYKDVPLEWVQERIPAGSYTLHFTQVPDGYATPGDMAVTIERAAGLQEFSVEVAPIRIAVLAVDDGTEKPAEGVQMRLEDKGGRKAAEWASGKDWEDIARIAPGTYRIIVDKVPDGYEVPQDVTIEVKDTEELQSFTVRLKEAAVPAAATADAPKTGDGFNVGLLAALAALACLLLGVGAVLAISRKRRRN